MSKDTTITSDLRSFFAKGDNNRAIKCIMGVMEHINIRPNQIGIEKKENCKLTALQVLNLLMLFPFFIVKNACRFSNSSLSNMFRCKKDMFYRFINDGNVRWRKILYAMNLQLIRKISSNTTVPHDKPICLIIDDTDAPKTGMKTELIGRIWSHVHQKSILGYKCLTMLLSDGVSQLLLDFSLHGEEGKDKQKIQGLTIKQRNARFTEDHKGQAVEERVNEFFMKKTDKAIEMVKYAIKRGIRFDYLLVDSWFTSIKFVRLITSRHIKCHLLGMVKLAKTNYATKYGDMNAKQIIRHLQMTKACKHNRTLRCTYCTIDVKLDGVPVRLFFCKRGRKGSWNGLLTTDLSLGFLEAYRLYARRWATEVAYKDCKTLLNLGKCQSVHFAAQIASFTLTMMQYNILCTVKRFEAYETIGSLFAEITNDTLELSVSDKIWVIIMELVLEIAEHYSIDATELLSDIIQGSPFAHTLRNMYIYKQAS